MSENVTIILSPVTIHYPVTCHDTAQSLQENSYSMVTGDTLQANHTQAQA